MKVTVYFSPSDAKEGVYRRATVILADVLRMSSTVAVHLSHGAKSVLVLPDPAAAKAAFAKLKRGEGLLAGETHWEKVAGFPLSGSPLDSTRDKVKGRIVCLSTRSALALKHLRSAETLLLGAFVNLSEVYDTVLRLKKDVVVVCGASDHGATPEDTVFAGMLCDFLQNTVGSEPVILAESARKAIAFYKPWQGRLIELLRESPEGRELVQKGQEKDLVFCARQNRVEGVPILRGGVFVRESAPKPRMKHPGSAKAEAAVPAKGKAIKVHVPLFPKNPEHPTPELDPKKKGSSAPVPPKPAAAKGSPKATAPSVRPRPASAGSIPAVSKPASGKPAAKGAVPAKPASSSGKGPSAKTPLVPGAKVPEKAAGKPPVRKTPLFSKRTVAAPYVAPKPADHSMAVTHAMDALKASLAHLKDRKSAQAAPAAASTGKVPAKSSKPVVSAVPAARKPAAVRVPTGKTVAKPAKKGR
jgi:2-phosphosulfolactate phosphatase